MLMFSEWKVHNHLYSENSAYKGTAPQIGAHLTSPQSKTTEEQVAAEIQDK